MIFVDELVAMEKFASLFGCGISSFPSTYLVL